MGGSLSSLEPAKLWMARPSCLRLFEHDTRLAASRTFCTAGSNMPIKMAMIAITTSNSIRVKAERGRCMCLTMAEVSRTKYEKGGGQEPARPRPNRTNQTGRFGYCRTVPRPEKRFFLSLFDLNRI